MIKRRFLLKISIVLLLLANFWDVSMTIYGLSHQVTGELNPILNLVYKRYGMAEMAVVKIVDILITVFLINFAYNVFEKNNQMAKAIALIVISFIGSIAFTLAGFSWFFFLKV